MSRSIGVVLLVLIATACWASGASASLLDASSYSNNGVLHGNTTYGNGYFGGGICFDGSAITRVEVSSIDAYSSPNLTVEAWVRLESATFDRGIIVKLDESHDPTRDWWLRVDPSGHLSVRVDYDTINGFVAATDASQIPVGEWVHVAFSVGDHDTLRLFRNGQVVAKTAFPYSRNCSSFPIFVGNYFYPVYQSFPGCIDEIRMSSVALTDLGDLRSPRQVDGTTLGLWRCNEFLNPLAITSGPTWSPSSPGIVQISWQTDRVSDSKVYYWQAGESAQEAYDSDQVTAHVVSLTGLNSGTWYYYVRSEGTGSGDFAYSATQTFDLPLLAVEGYVRDGNGSAIGVVRINMTGDADGWTECDPSTGYWRIEGLSYNHCYTFTPEYPACEFDPPSISFCPMTESHSDQNFTAIGQLYAEGYVRDGNGSAIGVVRVNKTGDAGGWTETDPGTGYWRIAGLFYDHCYTFTPNYPACEFDPPSVSFCPITESHSDQNFTAIGQLYAEGYVRDGNGSPIGVVRVNKTGDAGGWTETDPSTGYWRIAGLFYNHCYTFTPEYAGCEFDPPSISFCPMTESHSDQNFTAIGQLYAEGYVLDGNGSPIGVVRINKTGDAGGWTETDPSTGYWRIAGLFSNHCYTFTPEYAGCEFDPPSISFCPMTESHSDQNFTAIGQLYAEGYVRDGNGSPIGVVRVNKTGDAGGWTETDPGTGYWRIAGLFSNHCYTFTPAYPACQFEPADSAFCPLDAGHSDVNFKAIGLLCIQGDVILCPGTDPVEGVRIYKTGDAGGYTDSDLSGHWAVCGLFYGHDYVLTPSKEGYEFYPSSIAYDSLTTSHLTERFNAIPVLDVWTLLDDGVSGPSGRMQSSMAYDPTGKQALVFGGWTAGNVFKNDVWSYSFESGGWVLETTSGTSPSPRNNASAICDPVRHQMIIFAGDDHTHVNDCYALDLDTWTWSAKSSGATLRNHHTAVYDGPRDRMLVFGGDGAGGVNLSDLWEFRLDTGVWQLLGQGTVPGRHGHVAAVDPSRNRMLIFGGQGDAGFLNDLWAYDLGIGVWSLVDNGGSGPAPRAHAAGVWDESKQRLLVFGGENATMQFGDTWGYYPEIGAWGHVADSSASYPGRRSRHDAIYYPDAGPSWGAMVTFGGTSNGSYLRDLWEYGRFDYAGVETPGTVTPAQVASCSIAPTPFRDKTSISFGLNISGTAELQIYSVTGRLVRRIVDRDVPAGTKSFVWDGNDAFGSRVAPGIYQCRIVTAEGVVTGKTVVIR